MTAIEHSPPPTPPAPPDPRPPPARVGRLVAGILLVLLGTGWLLEVLGVTEFPWDLVLPAALILVGVALLVVATRGGSQVGLITTGIVITVLLLLGTAFDLPFGGGIGERYERPTSIEALGSEYRLGVGRLTLDLTGIADLDGYAATHPIPVVHMRVGVGHLVVIVPEGALLSVVGRAGLGNVQIFDEEDSGFDAGQWFAPRGGVDLELTGSVGLGDVEVRYG